MFRQEPPQTNRVHKWSNTCGGFTFHTIINKTLKFLLDTGSTHSFVDPLLVQPKNIQALGSPITIKTALDKHTITERTAWKMQ